MRRLNAFLVLGIFASLIAHAVAGSMQLMGGNAGALKTLALVSAGLIACHAAVTAVLTCRTLGALRKAKRSYFKDNAAFWIRRISGFAMLIPLIMHLFIFSASNAEFYRLKAFTAGRLVSQLLLVATLALHALSNVKPLMLSLGARGRGAVKADILVILSALLLLMGAAFLVYYLRWMRV